MTNLPIIFNFVPKSLLRESSIKYLDFARLFNFLVIKLKTDLLQSDIEMEPQRYINMSLFASIYFFTILSGISLVTLFILDKLYVILPFLGISFAIASFIFFYLLYYPRMITTKRMRKLERNLLTALRHVVINVTSGVPLFQALVGLSEGYDELSEEFKILINKVNAGVPLATALEDTAAKNPSVYFRRALLQISTAIKSGTDINSTLASITESISQAIITDATKYGRRLNFWAVFYLVISVIFPAMGLSFMVMLTSFLGFVLDIYIFIITIIFFILGQIFFLSLINNTKPSMVSY